MARNQSAQLELHRRVAPRYARRYGDPASRAFHSGWHAALLEGLAPGARVLDVGCGTGRLLEAASEQHPCGIGIDLSPDMLAGAAGRGCGARLIRGDAERLPCASASLDALLLKGCLHHLRDHAGFLREAWRVLRPGGAIVISEPQNDAPWVRLARWILYRLSSSFDRGDRGFRTRELEALVRAADFALESSRPFGVVAYAAAGFPDCIPLLRWMPAGAKIARCLMAFDELVLALPPAASLAFQRILVARKPAHERVMR